MKKIKTIEFLKKNKPTKEKLNSNLDEFKKQFDIQYPLILEKIKIASGKNLERLLEFRKDVEKLKKMADDSEKIMKAKGLRGKLKQSRFVMISSHKYMLATIRFLNKYKKENGDIDNFEI